MSKVGDNWFKKSVALFGTIVVCEIEQNQTILYLKLNKIQFLLLRYCCLSYGIDWLIDYLIVINGLSLSLTQTCPPVRILTSKYAGTICHSELRKSLVTPLSTRSTQIKQQKKKSYFSGFAFK